MKTLDYRSLYLMLHSSCVLVKFGISSHPTIRAKQVSDSVSGSVTPIVSVHVPFAGFWEGVGHTLCFFLRWRLRGNGGTEFFLLPAVLVFIPIQLVASLWWLAGITIAFFYATGS